MDFAYLHITLKFWLCYTAGDNTNYMRFGTNYVCLYNDFFNSVEISIFLRSTYFLQLMALLLTALRFSRERGKRRRLTHPPNKLLNLFHSFLYLLRLLLQVLNLSLVR